MRIIKSLSVCDTRWDITGGGESWGNNVAVTFCRMALLAIQAWCTLYISLNGCYILLTSKFIQPTAPALHKFTISLPLQNVHTLLRSKSHADISKIHKNLVVAPPGPMNRPTPLIVLWLIEIRIRKQRGEAINFNCCWRGTSLVETWCTCSAIKIDDKAVVHLPQPSDKPWWWRGCGS